MVDTVFTSDNNISVDELPNIPQQGNPTILLVLALVFAIIGLLLLLWPSSL
ncbi:MAG: hypothetical protein ACI37J_04300 [Candidatus Bruticola sp.]